jgi:peptide/nickel transport system permease protein
LIRYILNKITQGFFTILGVVTVVFFLFNILPGDPARLMLDQKEDSEQLAKIRKNLGLDQPIWKQYIYYLNDLSPISFNEHDDAENYTYLEENKYSYQAIFEIGTYTCILKFPYFKNKEKR